MFEAFIAYFSTHNILNEGYPTIFEDNGLAYEWSTSDLFQQLKDSNFQFEAVDDHELKQKIITTLRSLAETLETLKEQLGQAHLENSMTENGWERVSDGNNDLKDQDIKIRIRIKTLESYIETPLFTAKTRMKQGDSSHLAKVELGNQ